MVTRGVRPVFGSLQRSYRDVQIAGQAGEHHLKRPRPSPTLLDWILALFRNEDAARAFVAAPEQSLRDAGLAGVSAAQLSSVAATAVPGLVLGEETRSSACSARCPTSTASHRPTRRRSTRSTRRRRPSPADRPGQPQRHLAAEPQPGRHGANAQQGAFNLGFGDITLGDKTSNTATNGGVVVDGANDGDIVSGDGAVLGNGNDVNNGDVLAGTGSNVAVGHGEIDDNGTTATGGINVISDNSGPVFDDVDASAGNGGGAAGGGSLLRARRRPQLRRQRRRRWHHSDQQRNLDQQRQLRQPVKFRRQPHRDVGVGPSDDSVHQTTVTETTTHEPPRCSTQQPRHRGGEQQLDNSHDLSRWPRAITCSASKGRTAAGTGDGPRRFVRIPC